MVAPYDIAQFEDSSHRAAWWNRSADWWRLTGVTSLRGSTLVNQWRVSRRQGRNQKNYESPKVRWIQINKVRRWSSKYRAFLIVVSSVISFHATLICLCRILPRTTWWSWCFRRIPGYYYYYFLNLINRVKCVIQRLHSYYIRRFYSSYLVFWQVFVEYEFLTLACQRHRMLPVFFKSQRPWAYGGTAVVSE